MKGIYYTDYDYKFAKQNEFVRFGWNIVHSKDQHGTKIQALKARNTIYEWAVF